MTGLPWLYYVEPEGSLCREGVWRLRLGFDMLCGETRQRVEVREHTQDAGNAICTGLG